MKEKIRKALRDKPIIKKIVDSLNKRYNTDCFAYFPLRRDNNSIAKWHICTDDYDLYTLDNYNKSIRILRREHKIDFVSCFSARKPEQVSLNYSK